MSIRQFTQGAGTSVDYRLNWTARVPSGASLSSVSWSSSSTSVATVASQGISGSVATGRVTAVGASGAGPTSITCAATFSDASVDSATFIVYIGATG